MASRWVLAAGLVLLAGCSGGSTVSDDGLAPQVTSKTGGIEGFVVDEAIRPLPEITVRLGGGNVSRETSTDDAGRYAFDLVEPGFHFLRFESPLHVELTVPLEVEAGNVAQVPRITLESRFADAPRIMDFKQDGYIECSQAGAGLYSSSNCVADMCPILLDPSDCQDLPTSALDNVTDQRREWHMDVGPGWQGIVMEMTWEPSAQGTSDRLGMVVSTYKPTRDGQHSFATVISDDPLRLQLDVNVTHQLAASVEPTRIPWQGMQQVSYFVSVRPPEGSECVIFACAPPGLAIQQKFTVYVHQFYNAPVPPDWSFLAGDEKPY